MVKQSNINLILMKMLKKNEIRSEYYADTRKYENFIFVQCRNEKLTL